MSGAHTTDEPTNPGPTQDQPSRSGRLLSLVRKLIIFGNGLRLALLSRETSVLVTRRFGSQNVQAILFRILRALWLAGELEQRIVTNARGMDRQRPQATTGPAPDQPPARPDPDPANDALPAQRQRKRQKSIGAIIAEICRDLEIIAGDKLWLEIIYAVCYHRGAIYRFLRDMRARVRRTGYYVPDAPPRPFPAEVAAPWPHLFAGDLLVVGTGPP